MPLSSSRPSRSCSRVSSSRPTGSFTVGGETVIKNRLSSPAELDLSGVSFVNSSGKNAPAVWLNNAQNLYIFGGDASTADTGGQGILVYGSQHVLWWGFTIHDTGSTGFAARAINGPVDHDDFQGTISKIGQHLAWDTHCVNECGTGLHGANLWDGATAGNFTNNRFAIYAHDMPTGASSRSATSSPPLRQPETSCVPQMRQRNRRRPQTDRRKCFPMLGRHQHPRPRRQVPRRRQPPGVRLLGRRRFQRPEPPRRHHRIRQRLEDEPQPPLRRPKPLDDRQKRRLQPRRPRPHTLTRPSDERPAPGIDIPSREPVPVRGRIRQLDAAKFSKLVEVLENE